MVPLWPSSSTIIPGGIAAMAPTAPMTAGMPSEWARMAACAVLVPSSLMSPTTCSRSSCTVSPGESSCATTMTCSSAGTDQSSGPTPPISRLIIRSWIAWRSARRSRSRAAPDQRFRSSSALNSYAVSALSVFFRMSVSTEPRKSSSCAISIWASKMRDSSGPARCSTR
jgi:hypothetical protein